MQSLLHKYTQTVSHANGPHISMSSGQGAALPQVWAWGQATAPELALVFTGCHSHLLELVRIWKLLCPHLEAPLHSKHGRAHTPSTKMLLGPCSLQRMRWPTLRASCNVIPKELHTCHAENHSPDIQSSLQTSLRGRTQSSRKITTGKNHPACSL